MKKSFKKFLSILFCAIFPVITIYSVSATAQLTTEQTEKLCEFYQSYQAIRKTHVEKVKNWKCNLFRYLKELNNSVAIDFFLELIFKIQGYSIVNSIRPGDYYMYYDNETPSGSVVCAPKDLASCHYIIAI